MGFAFLLTLCVNIVALTPILYMLSIYDRVLNSRSIPTLISLLLIVIVIYQFWSALEWIRSRLLVRLSLRIDWGLSPAVFDAIFRRSIARRNLNAHEALNNVLKLRQFLTGGPMLAVLDAPFGLVFVIVVGIIHIYLAVFAIVASILMAIVTYAQQIKTTPLLRAANSASAEASRQAAFNLRNSEAAYALGMQGAVRHRWYDRHREFLGLQVNASESRGIGSGVSAFLAHSVYAMVLALAAYLAIEDSITAGMVIVSVMLLRRAIGPMIRLQMNWPEIVAARQAYDQLSALLLDDEAGGAQMRLPPPMGRLVVRDAAAVPPGATKAVLAGVNFTTEPGQTVAVVGPSAAGKTCLTKLLTGIWRPARGSVRLDGVEVCDWNHDELGALIGYVPQEIEFFEGTIAENIARLGPVNPEMVVEAAEFIGVHELILSLPQGYDTVLGEMGLALSAGQRQRIAIARALYGMPRFLVMDEPNSNLDENGELALSEAIAKLKQLGCTVIITTHRPRLINVVDYLLVLRAGVQLRYDSTKALLMEAIPNHPPGAANRSESDPGPG